MNRKAIFCAIIGLSFIILPIASNAVEVTAGFTQAVGEVTITDANGRGDMVFELSPGAQMSMQSTSNEFAVSTTNNKSKDVYRIEYGIYSAQAGYYQTPNENVVANDVVTMIYAPTAQPAAGATLANPFAADPWVYMGNAN